MKLSMRSDYGVRAVVELARRYGEGPVQSGEIAAREAIPEAYLEQLLTSLRKAGLVRSSRGPRGGHELAREPAAVSIGDVVAALEGPLLSLDCLGEPDGDPSSTMTVTRELWEEVARAANGILNATTVAALVERQQSREQRVMYYI
ncbi:MAG: Rrf2 family transcriptional regulator [Chloroflexi bacterium]|nr:Rrf2 family transcriptional regulator [Chloroflexota bacterium]